MSCSERIKIPEKLLDISNLFSNSSYQNIFWFIIDYLDLGDILKNVNRVNKYT